VVVTNLVQPPEVLIGRSEDLAAIAAALADDARVVTLTGPGGVGKTRLALEAALAYLGENGPEGGVWRAELGAARGLEGLCDAVAWALGVHGEAGRSEDPAQRLGRAIAARGEVLIVLDEVDALVEPAARAVSLWLALAPGASFLVTSRERLKIPGEIARELAPLRLPEGSSGASGASGEAVELFVRCVRRVRRDYALTEAEAPFVAAVVRALDGLPLGIELCAPRMAVMGARALLHRMQTRLDVLRRGDRGAGDRHATLDAAIDASWIALAPWERDALAQCSVFRGGFTLEAAEAVVDLRAHGGAPGVLEVIETLREKSLIHATETPALRGEMRLGVYASIRDFAARSLDETAARALEARHADHIVSAAESSAAGDPTRRARILAERDNLLAVIERVLGRGPVTARTAEPALRALLLLAPSRLYEGPLEAYVRLLDPVLGATRDSGADPRLQARALAVRGALRRQRGEGRAGARDLVQALAIGQTLGDAGIEARATHELGHALADRGETTAAIEHFERALALFRAGGDHAGMGDTLASLGGLLARVERHTEATALLERALTLHRAEGDPIAEASDRLQLGTIHLDAGRLAEARAVLDESRAQAERAADRRGEALARGALALADHLALDTAAAREGYERAKAILGELGLTVPEAIHTGHLGILCREEGRTAEAFLLLSTAVARLDDDAAAAAIFLAHLGALDADVGRHADAEAAFAEAQRRLAHADDVAAITVLTLARAHRGPSAAAPAIAAARPLADRSAAVRIALRCLDRAALAPTSAAPPPPDDALLIGPSGQWFRAPHAARIALDRRRPLALLLDRLARERLDRPGAPLAWDALLDAAWPGERVQAAAGAHRVRVAVSTLRKLGLKDAIRTVEEGYLLAPETPTLRLA
jgi:predicted ATPase